MNLLKKISFLLTPSERKNAVGLFLLMVVGMVLETLSIGLIIPAMTILAQDSVTKYPPLLLKILSLLGSPTKSQLIIYIMCVLAITYLFKNVYLAILAWRQTDFAFGIQVNLSQRLYRTYLGQPYIFHLQHNSAHLFRNITGEVVIFTTAIISTLLIATEGFVVVGIAILLLLVQPVGALIVLSVLGLASWGFYRFTKSHISNWGKLRQTHEAQCAQHLLQGLGGVKDVKLLGREEDFLNQYVTHSKNSARVGSLQATLQQIPRLWLEFLAVLGLTILTLSMLAQHQKMEDIIPTLGLFAAAAFRLMPSANRILASIQSVRYSLPVINTLYNECRLQLEKPKKAIRSEWQMHNEIKLFNVFFSYPDKPNYALENISLTIKNGECVGFIGTSGSGKSTLVDIILGLLSPSEGKVLVDGVSIQERLRDWQDQIGYVPQSIYVTDDTLRRNVAFGLSEDQIDNKAIDVAIKLAQLEEFTKTLPLGLETVLGERGVRLSGGQRQRIGIARALYHNPSILVLDEATSALDTNTEIEVMRSVEALQGTKTILIVAHRLSTIEHCDRVYCLENGAIVREGKPTDILVKQTNSSN